MPPRQTESTASPYLPRLVRCAVIATAALTAPPSLAEDGLMDGWSVNFPVQAAQRAPLFTFDIPAEPLAVALTRFSQVTGLKVTAETALIQNRPAPAVRGTMSADAALAALLAGSGLGVRKTADGALALTRDPVQLPALTVTADQETETATGPVEGYVATRSATGTKTDTPIAETPQSISVVGQDQIDARAAQKVAEALRYTAGVQAEVYGGVDNRADWINVRGMNESDFQNGLRSPSSGLVYGTWNVEPYGLDRIEVLKGPASVLYGQSRPGGIINLVSKRPSETPIHEVELQSGTWWREQLAADFSGRLTEDGSLLYRTVALGRVSQTQTEHADDNRGYFAPSLTWKPNSDTSLTLLTEFQEDQTGNAINFLPAEGTLLHNPNGTISTRTFTGDPDFDRYNQRRYALGYAFETKPTDNLTLRQNVRYGHLDLDARIVYGIGLEADMRTLDRLADRSKESTDAIAVDNQAEIRLDAGPVENTVLLGVDFSDQNSDYKNGSALTDPIDVFDPDYGADIETPAYTTRNHQHQRLLGLYAQDQIAIDRWRFVLGGRYDWARTATRDKIAGDTILQNDQAFTGRGGVAYVTDIGLVPYASYAMSFIPVGGTDVDGQPYKPEKGDQYEIGVKYQPEGLRSFVTLSAFQLTRSNVLTTDPADPTNQIQTGEVRSRGVEIEATASLAEGLDLITSYSYLDAQVTETNDASQGSRVADVPHHLAAAWLDYTVPNGTLEGLGGGAGIRYTGSTVSYSNDLETPDYVLVDAALHYTWNSLRFGLNVSNLFDKVYVTACDFYCFYGVRRTVTGTLKVTW
jgi:iron complex outermembrane receptor protein